MAIIYRKKYPNAKAKETHYRTIASNLRSRRNTIHGFVSSAKIRNPSDYENTKVQGEYYTKYVAKKNDWFTQFDQITNKFYSFLVQLDTCIQNADNNAKLWQSRIGIMEAYDDGK